MSITISTGSQLSPSQDEFDPAVVTDENSNVLPLVALAPLDSSGHSGVASNLLQVVQASSVTDKKQPPLVKVPGGALMPLHGLVGIDSSGNPIPFVAPNATQAVKVTGKFQSTVQTGTGSAQSIAHGLGVVPSLVLLSIYDTNGVSLPIAMSEGTHTTTNVLATVTSGVKYKVIAFA